jgi:hypothetical protein
MSLANLEGNQSPGRCGRTIDTHDNSFDRVPVLEDIIKQYLCSARLPAILLKAAE